MDSPDARFSGSEQVSISYASFSGGANKSVFPTLVLAGSEQVSISYASFSGERTSQYFLRVLAGNRRAPPVHQSQHHCNILDVEE